MLFKYDECVKFIVLCYSRLVIDRETQVLHPSGTCLLMLEQRCYALWDGLLRHTEIECHVLQYFLHLLYRRQRMTYCISWWWTFLFRIRR
jgi:hypothetical protein